MPLNPPLQYFSPASEEAGGEDLHNLHLIRREEDGDDGDGDDGDVDEDGDGVHPNSHKHFIPYMGFCASIWDSVRHHCHHHHHHHDHQK